MCKFCKHLPFCLSWTDLSNVFFKWVFLATDEVSNYNSICSYVITYCTKIMFDLSHAGDAPIFARLVCTLLQQDDKTAVACMLSLLCIFFFLEGIMRAHAAIKYCIYPATLPSVTVKSCTNKRSGRGVDHPPASSAEVKERVELYLYSLRGLF
jgi:hypothetical protein